MRIRLNTFLLGTSLVLMGSTITPAMAEEWNKETKFEANVVDVPVTTIADIAAAEDDAGSEPTRPTQPAQLGAVSTEDLDYAPMTQSERLKHYLNGTFGLGERHTTPVRAEI